MKKSKNYEKLGWGEGKYYAALYKCTASKKNHNFTWKM